MKAIIFLIAVVVICAGCSKFLDKKPDASLAVPSSVKDLQAILDDNRRFNQNQNGLIGEASADNYYLTDADWSALSSDWYRSLYTWGGEIFYDVHPNDWSNMYAIVFRVNFVLEKLAEVERTVMNAADWDRVKGSALFLRAEALHVIARNFAKAYNPATAANDLGIPVPLVADLNAKAHRENLENSLKQITSDLQSAIPLLPELPDHVMRPSKVAAYSLLSRVSLYTGDYEKAASSADSALSIQADLLDYNEVNTAATVPFTQFNKETIYYSHGYHALLYNIPGNIDSLLMQSYTTNDLRKQAFFKAVTNGTYSFKGNYTGSIIYMFTGIATDEVYLNKAEALARLGQWQEGIAVLNMLLVRRWKAGTFTPLTAISKETALQVILQERRKELLMRDLRWMDIKRLNLIGAGISLKRRIENQEIVLPPNDNRFALPIPINVILMSEMQQNPR